MRKRKVNIGTRRSPLALVQSQMVAEMILTACPELEVELVEVTTRGDRILDRPLEAIGGKGVFVGEMEDMLRRGDLDLAVHSAKDLPTALPEDLDILALPQRGDCRDVLITREGLDVNGPWRCGTGSPRRRAQISRMFPRVECRDLRGNVDTRLGKLIAGEYDGVVLAAAGLERLGIGAVPGADMCPLSIREMVPAACQGILAVEGRREDRELGRLLRQITHRETEMAFQVERRALGALEADCHAPVGVYAEIGEEDALYMAVYSDRLAEGASDWSDRDALVDRLVRESRGGAAWYF